MSKLWDTKLLQIVAESTLEMQKISVTESLSVHLTNKIAFCPNDIRNRNGDQHKNKESQSD